jgi:hypothetical protein
VTRRDFIVRRHELTERQFVLLSALGAGETIGAAIEQAAAIPGGNLDQFALDLGEWFRDWAANDFFQRISIDRPRR